MNYDKNIQVSGEHLDLALFIINMKYYEQLRKLGLKIWHQGDHMNQELINLCKYGEQVYQANTSTKPSYVCNNSYVFLCS